MPKLTYENELPSSEEFQKALRQAMANTNPIDDLLELANHLWAYEQNDQMSSADFHAKYQAGSLDDALQHCVEWVATYDFFLKTKRKLEMALMRAAIQPELFEPVS